MSYNPVESASIVRDEDENCDVLSVENRVTGGATTYPLHGWELIIRCDGGHSYWKHHDGRTIPYAV